MLQGTGQGRTRRTGRPGRPPESAQARPRRGAARLLNGFRWVCVDEDLDVGPEQFALITAIAGRTLEDGDEKLALLAVGDDQDVYAFRVPRSSSASASSATTAPGSLASPTTTGPSLQIVAVANRSSSAPPDAWRGIPSTSRGRAATTRRVPTGDS